MAGVTAPLPDGGVASDSAPTQDGTTQDGTTGGKCDVPGDNYVLYGAQIFKVSDDLTKSVLVAKVTNQSGLAFGSAGTSTTSTQIGSTLVVSDANCQFCGIVLPPVIVDGSVKAEPLWTIGFSAVKYFWSPGVPDHVVVWNGNGTNFLDWDLAQKAQAGFAGVAISGPGVNCTKLYAINGTISSTAYSVRFLAECGDGSGPTYATLADASGTKVGGNWQQDSFQSVASTQGMVTNPQIQVGDLKRGIYIGAANKIYKQVGGTFVQDTTTIYEQCNTQTGTWASGARPLIPAPKG